MSDRTPSPRLAESGPVAGRSELGHRLQMARAALGLEIAEVAAQLLLSKGQIADLESGSGAAFYNDWFGSRAAQDYARLLGVSLSSAPEPQPTLELKSVTATLTALPERRWPWIAGGASAVLLVAGILLGWRGTAAVPVGPGPGPELVAPRRPVQSPPPAPSSLQPAVATAASMPVVEEPEPLTLETDTPTWLFVRDARGKVLQQRIEAGQPLNLGSDPVYLVLGSERAVLRRGRRVRRLDPWAARAEIRLGRDALASILADLQP